MDGRRAQKINSGIRVFRLFGLWCPSCARSCERRIASVEGVLSAKVEFGSGQLHLAYDVDRVDMSLVQAKIKELGFSSLDFDGRPSKDSANAVLNSYRTSIVLGLFFMMWTMIIHVWMYVSPPPGDVGRILYILSSISTGLVLLFGGKSFIKAAYHTFKSRIFSLDQVIVVGSFALYLYSWQNLRQGSSEIYFDSISMTIVLLLLTRWLDFLVRNKIASHSPYWDFLGQSMSVKVGEGDSLIDVDASRLAPGKVFQIDDGEIPLDGKIIEGYLLLDESLISGESVPIRKSVGDALLAGSRILAGAAQIEVTHPIGDRYIDHLLLRNEASLSGSDTYGYLLEAIYRYWIPGLFLLGLITLVIKLTYDPSQSLKSFAMTFLIGCPCVFIIPTTIMRASLLQKSQSKGLHLRNIDFFERIKRIRSFVFDKTGTLTLPYALADQRQTSDLSQDTIDLMHFALRHIKHPLSSLGAIRGESGRFVIESMKTTPGFGTEMAVMGYGVLKVGKAEFADASPDELQRVHFSLNGNHLGSFAFMESLREGSLVMLQSLRAKGYKLVLATGDKSLSDQTRLLTDIFDDVRLNCTPSAKAQIVRDLKRNGDVCFVGDGLNDLGAFSEADLSISVMSTTHSTPVSASVAMPPRELRFLPDWMTHYSRMASLEKGLLLFGLLYNAFLLVVNIFYGIHPLLALLSFAVIGLGSGMLSLAFSRSVREL